MESSRFRFRDQPEMGDLEQFDESYTSSEMMSSVSSDVDDDSEPESMTGKGIKRLCDELMELKSASDEEFYQNVISDYSAFIRIFEEAQGMEEELMQLKRLILSEKELVKGLADGVYMKILLGETIDSVIQETFVEEEGCLSELEAHTDDLLEVLDTLLSEQRLDEALAVFEKEEVSVRRVVLEVEPKEDVLAFYNSSVSVRRGMLAKRFIMLAENHRVNRLELEMALSGLCRLGESQCAMQILIRHYHFRIAKGIQRLQASKSFLNEMYAMELSKFVFSTIGQAAKSTAVLFGESSPFASELSDWALEETVVLAESFITYLKSISEAGGGLYTAMEAVHIAMTYCTLVESQTLDLHPCLMEHICPVVEEVLEAHMRHFKKVIGICTSSDTWSLSRYLVSGILDEGISHSGASAELEYCLLTNSSRKFITLLQAIIRDVSPLVSLKMDNFLIEGLVDLLMAYISILEEAMKNDTKASEDLDVNAAESFLQQVSILISISVLADFFSSCLISTFYNTNADTTKSVSLDSQEIKLDQTILHVQAAVDHLRSQFFKRFIDHRVSVENCSLAISETCINKEHNVNHDMPSLKYQVLFTELRKLDEISEENAIEDGWLMELLSELMEAIFVSMSNDQNMWMIIGEDAQVHDLVNYKRITLDIQFLVDIARLRGFLSDYLLIASTTLVHRLLSIFISAGLDPDRLDDQWAANTATKAIQVLLELDYQAKVHMHEHEMIPEELCEESLEGGSFVENDGSNLSEEDVAEDNLEVVSEPEVVFRIESSQVVEPLDFPLGYLSEDEEEDGCPPNPKDTETLALEENHITELDHPALADNFISRTRDGVAIRLEDE